MSHRTRRAAAALIAGQADAATIKVKPGPNAIQKAVDRADPGDRLLVKRGTYREDVLVDKRLRIIGKGGKPPVINGRCRTDRTIDVVADGVTLRHLKVKGAESDPGSGYIHLLDDGGNTSDDNVLSGNTAADNGVADFFDEGTGNCGTGNSFPIDPC